MKTLPPEGLKPIPQKPFNHIPQKIEVGKQQPIQVDIGTFETLRLLVQKKLENTAFGQFQESIGKARPAGFVASGGLLGTINWPLLLTGNPLEIIKFIGAILVFVATWLFVKKN